MRRLKPLPSQARQLDGSASVLVRKTHRPCGSVQFRVGIAIRNE